MRRLDLLMVEQGLILAALLDRFEEGAHPLPLHGTLSAQYRGALEKMRGLSSPARRAAIAELTQRLFSPLPAHLERVHPSWIQRLLDEESPAVAAVAIQGLPAAMLTALDLPALIEPAPAPSAHVRRRLYELVWGRLAPMPAEAVAPPRQLTSWEELPAWTPARLKAALTRLGCLVFGGIISKIGPASRETLAQQDALVHRFGPFAAAIRAAQQDPIPLACDLKPPDPDHNEPARAVRELGLQAASRELPSPWAVQTAQLLPRDEGRILCAAGPDSSEEQPPGASVLSSLARADALARQAQEET